MKLFVWIPKTGGTSVYEEFKIKFDMKLYLDNYREFDNTGSVTFGHYDVKSLIKGQVITKDYWTKVHKLVVVRNPYHRFVSLYNDFLKSGRIFPDTTIRKFATILQNVTRKPGMYNVKDFSQAASQIDWIFDGVEIYKLEDWDDCPHHLNKSTEGNHMDYYTPELIRMVTDLYYDDFTILGYDIL